MIVTLVLIAVSMTIKDVAYSIATYLISKGHGWAAGVADGFGDIASVLSIGVTAILTVHNGVSLLTFEAMIALLFGSVTGSVVGTKLGQVCSARLER